MLQLQQKQPGWKPFSLQQVPLYAAHHEQLHALQYRSCKQPSKVRLSCKALCKVATGYCWTLAFATLGMVHGLMCLAPWFVESQKCSSFWVARVANEFQHVLLDVQATLTTAAAMTPQMRMTPAAAAVTATLTATVTSPLPAASAQQQAQLRSESAEKAAPA